MEILIIAIVIGCIPAAIAQSKGHSFVGWWVYGTLLFIVALPHSLLLKRQAASLEAQALAGGARKCPYCAELIRREAVVCRYCHRDLPALSPAETNPFRHLPTYYEAPEPAAKPQRSSSVDPLMVVLGVCATAVVGIGVILLVSQAHEPAPAAAAAPVSSDGFTCDTSLARNEVGVMMQSGTVSLATGVKAPQTTIAATVPAQAWDGMSMSSREMMAANLDCAFAAPGQHLLRLRIRDKAGRSLTSYTSADLVPIRKVYGPPPLSTGS